MKNQRCLVGAAALACICSLGRAQDVDALRKSEEALKDLLRPIPPREPAEALEAFETRPGFRMELIAQEPMVFDPVSAAVDENGLLYVAELIDYPYRPKEGESPRGRIRLLSDADGDGRYDRSTVFADKLLWAAGIAPWKGGVFITAPPDIWYMLDTDADGIADEKRMVYTGFGTGGAQYILNNAAWGLDHWIYAAVAGNGGRVKRADDSLTSAVDLCHADVRWSPVTGAIEAVSGNEQFGNTFDDWGNRFLCNQSQPLHHVVLPRRYLERNPALAALDPTKNLVPGPTPIFRTSPIEGWRIVRSSRRILLGERSEASTGASHNVLDSVAGTTIYRGDAYGPTYHGQAFAGDSLNNLIHRRGLLPEGVTFRSDRLDDGTEFVRSSDNWFRPVNFVNAPDGTLWVLDMSREVIEAVHIPFDVVAHLDLTSGRDRGRIYRIRPDAWTPPEPPRLGKATTEVLVGHLENPKGWWRDTAHRLIHERQDRAAVAPLRRMLAKSAMEQARLHALWSLEGLGSLAEGDLVAALGDAGAHVREHAVALAESRLATSEKLLERVAALAADAEPRVRMQVAFALGEVTDPRATEGLARIARNDSADAWIRAAVLSSCAGRAGALLGTLAADKQLAASVPGLDLLHQLAQMAGAGKRAVDVGAVLGALSRDVDSPSAVTQAIALGLAEGLESSGSRLEHVRKQADLPARSALDRLTGAAVETLADAQAPAEPCLSAIRWLGYADVPLAGSPLVDVLDRSASPIERREAVRSLSRSGDPRVVMLLLERWRAATPEVRAEMLAALLTRKERAGALLDAVEEGGIAPGEITPAARARLRESKDARIAARTRTLLDANGPGSRREAIDKFKLALDLPGDFRRGKEVFTKLCATCHRLAGDGSAIGPNLALTQIQSPAELLVSILDPNREVNPSYLLYTFVTHDGRDLTGIIAAETSGSVTLRQPTGEVTIQRENIREMTSNGLSLMPEGLEQDLTPQGMADLLALLRDAHYDVGTPGESPEEK